VNPPVWFAVGLGTVLLSRILNVPGRVPKAARIVGIPLIGLGLALGVSAAQAQGRAGTSVDPKQPSRKIVQTGPYRFTRNPIYLGMALVIAGAGLALNAAGSLFYVPTFLVAMDQGMVRREEAYLEKRFGSAYRRYQKKVRRWL
jgi:protein-S-isoprenylcysteine O-methyltransferase Ste14